MSRFGTQLRVVVLVALGAWIVHQLRYALASGESAAAHAHAHTHQYLDLAGPLIVLASAIAMASWIVSLCRPSVAGGRRPSWKVVWARTSLVLLVVYLLQETGEGALAPGHPDILMATLGGGGWIAIPLSVAIGAAIALLVVGARVVRRAVAAALAERHPHSPQSATPLSPGEPAGTRRSCVLSTNLAGRAPPLPA